MWDTLPVRRIQSEGAGAVLGGEGSPIKELMYILWPQASHWQVLTIRVRGGRDSDVHRRRRFDLGSYATIAGRKGHFAEYNFDLTTSLLAP